MKKIQSQSNTPRNVIIAAIVVSVVLGIFREIFFIVAVWVIALIFLTIYQYKPQTRRSESNFVCLECDTIHQEMRCPQCGSNLKKFHSRSNRYGNQY